MILFIRAILGEWRERKDKYFCGKIFVNDNNKIKVDKMENRSLNINKDEREKNVKSKSIFQFMECNKMRKSCVCIRANKRSEIIEGRNKTRKEKIYNIE